IFRTSSLLFPPSSSSSSRSSSSSHRTQTLITKAGGLRGYTSQFLLIPEYGIGITVLVAGDGHALAWLREKILQILIPAVEAVSRAQTAARLAGTYTAAAAAAAGKRNDSSGDDEALNSSITISMHDPPGGLTLTRWISNSTDFLAVYTRMSQAASHDQSDRPGPAGHVQLTPARTRRGGAGGADGASKRRGEGEVWRAGFVLDEFVDAKDAVIDMRLVTDVDTFTYAARSLEEFVFWGEKGGKAERVELPGLRVVLGREEEKGKEEVYEGDAEAEGWMGRLQKLQKVIKPLLG
ncbi:MAG: hypothetical protein LQ346_009093, partial [Caloplaca aetnensis]